MPLPVLRMVFHTGADAAPKGFERRGVSLEVARLSGTKYVNMPSLGSCEAESGCTMPARNNRHISPVD